MFSTYHPPVYYYAQGARRGYEHYSRDHWCVGAALEVTARNVAEGELTGITLSMEAQFVTGFVRGYLIARDRKPLPPELR